MNNTVKQPKKRVSTNLVYFLMDCHERELMKLPPIEATHRSVKGLIARGLLQAGQYIDHKSKISTCAYITPAGKAFLNEIANR